ncbi:hypothetical protein ACMU_16425 [Actibacterium mucosum KCTC 23349]|uniref:HTH marR-type domain-containing protein n=2 Tax=Actibacterium TaxID=1433986 RepID=A0A037ZIN5_9RHOB|nr:hypothetical protein ACMU_16425 [Actibacterium mucosum KCTC 23349]
MTDPSLARLLLSAFTWFDTALRASLAARGLPELTHAQSLLMAHLQADGIRISELARRVGTTRQAAQKSVAALERAGLVETAPDPTNASARIARLTPAGLRNITAAAEVFAALELRLADRIGAEAAKQLRAALQADWGAPNAIDPAKRET